MSSPSKSDRISTDAAHAGLRLLSEAHYSLLEAHLSAGRRAVDDSTQMVLVHDLDALALLLAEGKWHLAVATGDCADFAVPTSSSVDLAQAVACLSECVAQGRMLIDWLEGRGIRPDLSQVSSRLRTDHEIFRMGAAPIVPSICPIVMLAGSWSEMGAQYVRQCVEIFGDFVFDRPSRRQFDAEALHALKAWAQELATYAPSVHAFALGMSQGSQVTRSPMTPDQAVALWTGWQRPSDELEALGVPDSMTTSIMSYFGALRDESAVPESHDLCSGFASWGDASVDGALIAGATTDHDATFQATIVAYPTEGKPFVYTPFSVNGSIPGVGYFQFAGLPGVNREGLCYVHHGGAIGAGAEPASSWGYGLRRGASTVAILATCGGAHDALSRELSWPVGDAAAILGAPGGFYADPHFGYVLEARQTTEPLRTPIVRHSTVGPDGRSHSFLYANNNCLDPRSRDAFCPPVNGYEFEAATGWFTLRDSDCRHPSPAIAGRRMWTKSSESRNRYLYRELLSRSGHMTSQRARDVYARGPQFCFSSWSDLEAKWAAGERLDGSTAHRGNAFTALVRAERGADPEYWACMGNAAGPTVTPNRAGHGYFYYDETYTFWRIVLTESPEAMVNAARDEAVRLISAGRQACSGQLDNPRHLHWLREADMHLTTGDNAAEVSAGNGSPADRLSRRSRQLREFTRAQVRARQVLRARAPQAEMTGKL